MQFWLAGLTRLWNVLANISKIKLKPEEKIIAKQWDTNDIWNLEREFKNSKYMKASERDHY